MAVDGSTHEKSLEGGFGENLSSERFPRTILALADYKIKICGVCRPEDARMASEAGADFIGVLVDVPGTPRSRAFEDANAIAAKTTAPLVLLLWEPGVERAAELARALHPHAIQLLADESPDDVRAIKDACGCRVWKAIHLPARGSGEVRVADVIATIRRYEHAGADAIVLDAKVKIDGVEHRGGTGQASDWAAAAQIVCRTRVPVLMAGGITPDNASAAILMTHPFGVDVSTGVESEKCRKDPEEVRRIIERVHAMSGPQELGARNPNDE